ncbi:MAG: copper-binding protein [Alphaproteobacteria bacterium]
MKRTLFVGILVLVAFVAAPGSVRASSEIEASFIPDDLLAQHQIVATSCARPRGFRRIEIKGGTRFARAGEVFAFEPREIRVARCEEVEIVLENTDAVRHALMLPGLNPMFTLEFTGRGVRSLRFVTPDEDVTLEFHCHVPSHEQLGMLGILIVGKGGTATAREASTAESTRLFEGIGGVVAVDRRKNRLVLNHEEIKGFMAAMAEMSFLVTPATLLNGIEAGDKVRFTIDADKRAIVDVVPLDR